MSTLIVAHGAPDFLRDACGLVTTADRVTTVRPVPILVDAALADASRHGPCAVLTEVGPAGVTADSLLDLVPRHPHARFLVAEWATSDDARRPDDHSVMLLPRERWERELSTRVRDALATSPAESARIALEHCCEQRISLELPNDPRLLLPVAAHVASLTQVWNVDVTTLFELRAAIEAALSNALFHGNLEVGDARDRHRIAEERRDERPYNGRRIHVEARVDGARARFVVRDEGRGFDPNGIRPGHGWQAMHQVDEVRHEERGRAVTLVKHNPRLQPASQAAKTATAAVPAAAATRPATMTPPPRPAAPPALAPVAAPVPKAPAMTTSAGILADELVLDLVGDDPVPGDLDDDVLTGSGTASSSAAEKKSAPAATNPNDRPVEQVRINRDVTDLLDVAPTVDPFGDD